MELKIKDLYKSYDHGKTYAINDVSADFTPGIYGILGPNGAGKSTMFGMLTDNLRPDKGSITADGEDIYKMGADSGRRSGICHSSRVFMKHLLQKSSFGIWLL